MKRLVSILFVFCCTGAYCQTNGAFSIRGFLAGWNEGEVKVFADNKLIGSAVISNDLFSIQGTTSSPRLGYIHVKKQNRNAIVPVFIEPGVIKLRAKNDVELVASGTELNVEYAKINDSISRQHLLFANEKTETLIAAYINAHRNSLVSLQLLKDHFYLNAHSTDSLYSSSFSVLADHLKSTLTGEKIADDLIQRGSTREGKTAQEFSLADASGIMRPVFDASKITLVHFWASWCVPCKKEQPFIKRLSENYAGDKFMVVNISIDTHTDAWRPATQAYGPGTIQLVDIEGWKGKAVKYLGVKSIPENILIGPGGTIISRHVSLNLLEEKIKMLMLQ